MTRKKYIAFFLPSLNIGGVEQVFICYANYLLKKDYKVDFILCKVEGLLLERLSTRIHIVSLGNVRLKKSFWKLRGYLKCAKPDWVMTGGDFPNLVLLISTMWLCHKPKIIISQHNYNNTETKQMGVWAKVGLQLMKRLYPHADKVVAISDGIYEYLNRDLRIPINRLIKLNNPIDIEGIRVNCREKINFYLPPNYIVFIGRFSVVKNLPFLLHSFDSANLNGMSLVIVGDGNDRNRIEDTIAKMVNKDKVYLMGALSNPLPVLLKAKALALPSLSEAFPTILLEAMCLGKPIVSTPTKGAIEILKGYPLSFVSKDFEDIPAFSSLLAKAVGSSSLNNLAVMDRYSINSILNKFEKDVIS